MNEAESNVPALDSTGKKKWKTLPIPSKEILYHVFRYDPESGKLIRREDRPKEDFNGARGYARYIRDFAGKEAGAYKRNKVGDAIGVYVRIDKERHMAHRIVWGMHHGDIPTDKMIDHINGNPFDNRIENLRLVSSAQNQWNSKRSGYRKKTDLPKGVFQVGKRFRVISRHNGKNITIGRFDSPEEARIARDEFLTKLRGEYHRL